MISSFIVLPGIKTGHGKLLSLGISQKKKKKVNYCGFSDVLEVNLDAFKPAGQKDMGYNKLYCSGKKQILMDYTY